MFVIAEQLLHSLIAKEYGNIICLSDEVVRVGLQILNKNK
jgi:hypothetical protein